MVNLATPATSNQAEHDLRPAKAQQKISGRLRYEQATSYRVAHLRLHFHGSQHGVKVLGAIRDALLGRHRMVSDPPPA